MYRHFYLTTALYAILLITGCDKTIEKELQSGVFYISNHNNTPLVFKINNQPFLINSGEVRKIILENGEHVLVDPKGNAKSFMVYPGNHGGIINPSRSLYYSFTVVLTPQENERSFLATRSVWVNGKLIKGAISSSDAVFIDNNVFRCDIPLNEPLPTSLSDGNNKLGNVLTKCFSQVEFQQFLAHNPDGIHIYSDKDLLGSYKEKEKFNWVNEKNTRTDDFLPVFNSFQFNNSELQQEAENIYKITHAYLASRDPNEKNNFYNQYHLHIMAMSGIYRQQIQNDILDDKEAYFQLINETGRIFGAGILSEPTLK